MTETARNDDHMAALEAFGADLSRWPAERSRTARQALLSDPAFRRAWEEARRFDAALAADRDGRDAAIAASGAVERLRAGAMGRLPAGRLGRLPWQRIAAAMLVAGMLGGVMDVFLAERIEPTPDLVLLDPLFSLDDTTPQ